MLYVKYGELRIFVYYIFYMRMLSGISRIHLWEGGLPYI